MIKVSFGQRGPHAQPLVRLNKEQLRELATAVLSELERQSDPMRLRKQNREQQLSLFAVNLVSRRRRDARLPLDEWYADIERRLEAEKERTG